MRIIAGKFRRRKLHTNPGSTTRPITDRVKESLFESIQARFQDKRVADIFSGTGTIGLEVLSRGAKCVTFIERDKVALELLRENISMLKCEDETFVWPADVLRCSFLPKGDAAMQFLPWDTVFFDPPYSMVSQIVPGRPLWLSLKRLCREEATTGEASLILRTSKNAEFEIPSEWECEWTNTQSGMSIHVYRKNVDRVNSTAGDQTGHS